MMKPIYFKAFFVLILSILITEYSFSANSKGHANKQMVVIIDPGHGGKDPGAVNKNVREKDVVLGVGLKLGKFITENFPDVKIIFTRSTDVFVPLIERSRIANKNKASLFISIHANTCSTPSIRGTETFFLGVARSDDNLDVAKKENAVILLEDNYANDYEGFDPNLAESYIMFETVQGAYLDQSLTFADDIQKQFQSQLKTANRGVKQAGFLVLRQSSMPSVLIETGFISNQAEASYLSSNEGQEDIAQSILEAFKKFKSRNTDVKTTDLAQAKTKKEETPIVENKPEYKKDSVTSEKTDTSKENLPEKVVTNTPHKVEIKKEEQKQATEKITPEKVDHEKSSISTNQTNNDKVLYYSVQIAASITSVEPTPSNFKGLKELRREKTDKYYRFYLGKETDLVKIKAIREQVKSKYPQAFIVSFEDGKRAIVKE